MKATCLLLVWSVGSAWAAAPAPDGSPEETNPPPVLALAKVTLPYTEMKALLEMADTKARQEQKAAQSKPPVPAMLVSSQYELVLSRSQATLEASYHARALSDGWQTLPLLGGDARLEQADLKEATVLWQDPDYCLLTEGKGECEAKLRFALTPPSEWTRDKGLHLRPGTAALNRLRISGLPARKMVHIRGVAPADVTDGVVTYHLPAGCTDLVLTLEDDQPPAPPVSSRWGIQSEVFVRYHEGRLVYQGRIYAQAEDGSGLTLDLGLPASATAITMNSDDLAQSQLGPRENGRRTLHVQWKTRDVLDRKLEMAYELPQSPLSTNWVLYAPQVLGGADARTLFVILPVPGLELAGANLKDSVQSRRLPDWLRERVGSSDFLTTETGTDYPLQATWLPRVETAQALVSQADYQTQLVADGALLVTASFTIQHQAPLNWRVQLPAVDEILACQVNRKPVQPVRRGQNDIEFPLAAPNDQATQVTFSYAARLSALDPVSGRIALELPRTDLFTQLVRWNLAIPDTYETTAIEGNVGIARADLQTPAPGALPEPLIRLKKELVRGEAPAAEIYYQRRGLND